MRRRLKALQVTDTQEYRTQSEVYKRHAAAYRRSVISEKTQAWKKFCSNTTDPFGTQHKIYTGKLFTPDEALLQQSANLASRQASLHTLTQTLFGPSVLQADEFQNPVFTTANDLPFTRAEIFSALHSFNVNKAPGPDCIDFKILRLANATIPNILTRWANLCLKLNYFPQPLRQGEVVYFSKKGKDPKLPTSYRPICLLPTLGKLLEKLLVVRLTHHLETNNQLHHRQYGFREGRSCDRALADVLLSCEKSIAQGLYTSLVSLDIQGAFDNIEWRDIIQQLHTLRVPANLAGVVSSYLSNRSVLINWGAGQQSHRIEKGCPQGSCLGPLLWLLMANVPLQQLENQGFNLFAFADDFSFVLSGRRRRDLEEQAHIALTAFHNTITQLHLNLSPGKSQAMVFTKPRPLNREPIMRINGQSLRHVQAMTILGITIDKNRLWTNHLNAVRLKTVNIFQNSIKLVGKNWGVCNKILKIWYLTTIEKILLYGAGIWGGNLTKQNRNKLATLQRPFLLQMSRGYKTISTDALCTLTGIPPLAITLDYEYRRSRILQLGDDSLHKQLVQDSPIQHKSLSWQIHPATDQSSYIINTVKNSHTESHRAVIYTDGSKTCRGVASAFCVIENGTEIHRWSRRLGDSNTVYQAELFAILQALTWCEQQDKGKHYTLYSDSLSSLQAIKSLVNKHPVVLDIKFKLRSLVHRINMGHVSAHTGVHGNELADTLAKEATEHADQFPLPLPPSFEKRTLKHLAMKEWQTYWTSSTKGRHTHNLIPKVSLQLYNLTPHTTAFLSGHGPFNTYLQKFTRANTSNCVCGEVDTPLHAYTECTLTEAWHLRFPTPQPHNWLHNILNRPQLVHKLYKIFQHKMELSQHS